MPATEIPPAVEVGITPDEVLSALSERLQEMTIDELTALVASLASNTTRQPAVSADDGRWNLLRESFPPEQVGKLPRVWCRACSDAPRGQACQNHAIQTCSVCRNKITTGHLHLDYVGHAAVTSRLLAVDPFWSWRPATKAELEDLPPINREREMWIVLTVLGHSRFGLGDDAGRGGTDGKKIMIGDALRNAAMRFGVAIDVWSKEDLSAKAEADAEAADEVRRGLQDGDAPQGPPGRDWAREAAAAKTLDELEKLAHEANEAGVFQGAIRAAMATRRRKLENDAKSAQPKGQ